MGRIGYLLGDLWSMFRWRLVALVVLVVVTGLIEGVAMALLFPLLQQLGVGAPVETNDFAAALNRWLTSLGVEQTVVAVGAFTVATFILQYVVFLGQSWLAARVQHSYVTELRRRLLRRLLHANWQFFVSNKAAELSNAVLTETVRAGGAFYLLVQILATGFITAIYALLAVAASWQVTLFLALVAGLIVAATFGFVRRAKAVGEGISHDTENLLAWCGEVFGGIKLVKATAAEDFVEERFAHVNERLRALYFWMSFQPNLLRAIFEGTAIAGLVTALIVSTQVLAVDIAVLVVVLALFVRLYPRISGLQQNLQLLNLHLPAVEYVRDLEVRAAAAIEPSLADLPTPLLLPPGGVGVDVHDVSVSYGDRPALRGVTLEISPGRVTAIVGESGAGKTTLLDCLLRLVEPDEGRILVDGKPLYDIPLAAWRRSVGYVSQDTILFNATIGENIAWSDSSADRAAIEEAARRANAHGFIMATPDGYETQVGDRGVRLSGGQRQRIGLARALLRRKSLLILDEATSALDANAETEVMQAIQALHGEVTIVIVAHRLATVRLADQIYLLQDGRLAESGSWPELLQAGGKFSALWELQSRTP